MLRAGVILILAREKRLKTRILLILGLLHAGVASAQSGTAASVLTERDFLGEMPVVLSVTRLLQRLDETPGAVTLLDRNFIRMSGARDVADLLRVVPGFQTTTTFETDAPMASYHGRVDDWSNRLQVLVDGRSVYSGFLQGSVGLGLQTLALEDIERIEVFRGSNSATYGARAFLGVVNIVSKDVRQTLGTQAQVTVGGNGVGDVGIRQGWGDDDAAFRLSVDTRGDNGLRKVAGAQGDSGGNRIGRVNFSGLLAPDASTELNLRAGFLNVQAYRGDLASVGNLQRMRFISSGFAQMDWRRVLGPDEELQVGVSLTRMEHKDGFPYLNPDPAYQPYYGIRIGFDGREDMAALQLQYTRRHSDVLRTVVGIEVRSEGIVSPDSFDGLGGVQTRFARLFGNAEWRLTPSLVLNVGGLAEQSTLGGDTLSPRAMLNWHLAAAHTLRAGMSTGFRPPSAYEQHALVNYYDLQGSNPQTTVRSTGNLVPEKVRVRELGYHLNLPAWGFDGDLRVFHEQIRDGIRTPYTAAASSVDNFANLDNYDMRGAEFQVDWHLAPQTRILWSQTWTDISEPPPMDPQDGHAFRVQHSAPRLAGSLAVMHSLPSGVDLAWVYHQAQEGCLMSCDNRLYSMERTDLRMAKRWRVGKARAELALTLQNINAPYQDGDSKFYFDRRGLLTLRLEH